MVRGEPIRMLLSHAKVHYLDKKIPFADWPGEHKKEMPNGQMPALELFDENRTKIG